LLQFKVLTIEVTLQMLEQVKLFKQTKNNC